MHQESSPGAKSGEAEQTAIGCSCIGLHLQLQTRADDEWDGVVVVQRRASRSVVSGDGRPMRAARLAWGRPASLFWSTTTGSLTDFLSCQVTPRALLCGSLEVSDSVRRLFRACHGDVEAFSVVLVLLQVRHFLWRDIVSSFSPD
jgi:hypothetical protein